MENSTINYIAKMTELGLITKIRKINEKMIDAENNLHKLNNDLQKYIIYFNNVYYLENIETCNAVLSDKFIELSEKANKINRTLFELANNIKE